MSDRSNQEISTPRCPKCQETHYPAITDTAFVNAVRDIVQADPGHIYEGPTVWVDDRPYGACVYEHAGAPSCLIGQGLHRVGISIDALRELDRADSFGPVTAVGALESVAPGVSPQVRMWARLIQTYQDTGSTWGEALERADDLHPSVAAL